MAQMRVRGTQQPVCDPIHRDQEDRQIRPQTGPTRQGGNPGIFLRDRFEREPIHKDQANEYCQPLPDRQQRLFHSYASHEPAISPQA